VTAERKPLRMEDIENQKIPHRGLIWYMRASDTGVIVGVKNPRMEADGDDDGIRYTPAHDGLVIVDDGMLREPTDEESDEYSDDVYAFLLTCDWSD
jgi:hypothetical protein